jgi:hypothetical protein
MMLAEKHGRMASAARWGGVGGNNKVSPSKVEIYHSIEGTKGLEIGARDDDIYKECRSSALGQCFAILA